MSLPKKTVLVEIAVWSEDPLSEHCCSETRTTTIMSVRKKQRMVERKKVETIVKTHCFGDYKCFFFL